jgi:hypothetical protein
VVDLYLDLKPFEQVLECPRCKHEFVDEVSWDNCGGSCPQCALGWYLDEVVAEDYSDSWEFVMWDPTKY